MWKGIAIAGIWIGIGAAFIGGAKSDALPVMGMFATAAVAFLG